MAASGRSDPFAGARDPLEEGAAACIREHWIRGAAPARIYRQRDDGTGYALVVPATRGERLLTIPGQREADFAFHGEPGTTTAELADFVARSAEAARAELLRLPLLSRRQASTLRRALATRLPDWRLAAAASAVAPLARKRRGGAPEPSSLRRALQRAARAGATIEPALRWPAAEGRALHRERWGDNRDEGFFGMLHELLERRFAEVFVVRAPDGRLAALHFDILGGRTRHYYYSVAAPDRLEGAGTMALAASWRRFAADPRQRLYSFGRGGERYKYRYATGVRELYELRGFYAPVGAPRRGRARAPGGVSSAG